MKFPVLLVTIGASVTSHSHSSCKHERAHSDAGQALQDTFRVCNSGSCTSMGVLKDGRNGKAAVIGIVGLQTCGASEFCSAEGWNRDEPLQPRVDAV